jgi:hypothetical protein
MAEPKFNRNSYVRSSSTSHFIEMTTPKNKIHKNEAETSPSSSEATLTSI